MKLGDSMHSIFAGELNKGDRPVGIFYKEKDKTSLQNNFAGNRSKEQDTIAVRKQLAQEKALKIVADCNEKETSLDENMDQRRQHMVELEKSSASSLKIIQEYKDKVEEIKKRYGVTEESGALADGTENKDLSEYEQEVLPYEEAIEKYSREVNINQATINNEQSALISVSLERLKYHGMVDAQKDSEAIVTSAAKEAAGSMLEEVKEQVEENIKEAQEKQDEIEEKVEEKKEQIEEVKQKRTEETKQQDGKGNQEITKQQDSNGNQEIMKQLKKVIVEENLIEEDLKGIVMDEQL